MVRKYSKISGQIPQILYEKRTRIFEFFFNSIFTFTECSRTKKQQLTTRFLKRYHLATRKNQDFLFSLDISNFGNGFIFSICICVTESVQLIICKLINLCELLSLLFICLKLFNLFLYFGININLSGS